MNSREYARQLVLAERRLGRADPLLRGLIKRHGPCGLAPRWRQTPYEALVRAVIYQQLSGAAAATILGRFLALLGGAEGFPAPAGVLATTDEALLGVGLSRQKVAYLRAIAAASLADIIPQKRAAVSRVDDEDIIGRFTQVKGVGRWTAEMLLIFTLGRLDVLPVDDLGVRKGHALAAGLDSPLTPRELGERGRAWAPYRSVAAWYFWQEANRR